MRKVSGRKALILCLCMSHRRCGFTWVEVKGYTLDQYPGSGYVHSPKHVWTVIVIQSPSQVDSLAKFNCSSTACMNINDTLYVSMNTDSACLPVSDRTGVAAFNL